MQKETIVEYIGLPGAGKTYLAQKHSKETNIPVITINSKCERYSQVSLFLVRHPILFCYISCMVFRYTKHNIRLLRHKYFFLFFNAVAREQKANRLGIGIIDEGLFQFSLSLFESKVGKSRMQAYMSIVNKLPERKINLVQASLGSRWERMLQRKRVPREAFGQDYAHSFLQTMEYNLGVLEEIFEDKSIIDNSTRDWNPTHRQRNS